jgi:hypothetical protein
MAFGNCSIVECSKENVYLCKGMCGPCYKKQRSKQWNEDNKEHNKKRHKQYYENNKEHWKQYKKQYSKQWHIDNPEYQIAKDLEREDILEGRTFPGEERDIHFLIKGIRHQNLSVEHQMPLRGFNSGNGYGMSGLHNFANIVGLPLSENISKGNRTWPDMWESY